MIQRSKLTKFHKGRESEMLPRDIFQKPDGRCCLKFFWTLAGVPLRLDYSSYPILSYHISHQIRLTLCFSLLISDSVKTAVCPGVKGNRLTTQIVKIKRQIRGPPQLNQPKKDLIQITTSKKTIKRQKNNFYRASPPLFTKQLEIIHHGGRVWSHVRKSHLDHI